MTNFAILLFDDCEELDVVGPWEVFAASASIRDREHGRRVRIGCIDFLIDDRVFTVAEFDRPIRCNRGMHVLPDHTLEDHPHIDVLLVPGGTVGTRRETENERLLGWIREVDRSASWMTSVRAGSLLLHRSGVATDMPLARGCSGNVLGTGDATVVRGRSWSDHGKYVSGNGVSAGIDMTLWLIGQIVSPEHARTVQNRIEYDPAPPYAA